MFPRQTIFHLIVLVGSLFSTFPHVSPSSSTARRWKTLPAKGSKPPEPNVMEIDDDVMPNPLIRQHGTVTSESEHVTDDVTEDKAEQLVEGKVTGEFLKSGKAGEDERPWGKTGKQKWGQNSLSVWGKRPSDDNEGGVKRKWGENTMSVWGKRGKDFDNYDVEERKQGENTAEGAWKKRRFHEEEDTSFLYENPGTVAMTGHKPEVTQPAGSSGGTRPRTLRKRSVYDLDQNPGSWYGRFDQSQWTLPSRRAYPRSNDGPKRKWETNTMKVWGKRGAEENPYDMAPVAGKRQWSSDNAIRIWGKRDAGHPLQKNEERPFGRFYDAYEN